jgi:hypothetical protein
MRLKKLRRETESLEVGIVMGRSFGEPEVSDGVRGMSQVGKGTADERRIVSDKVWNQSVKIRVRSLHTVRSAGDFIPMLFLGSQE